MMEAKKIFFWIIFIGVVIYLLIGFAMGTITYNSCKDLCEKENAVTFQRIQNNRFNLNDICVCYFSDSVKAIVLGG